MVAAPQAPSLYLPQPPTDLTAVRTGDDVVLHWTMPKNATDKAPLKGDQEAYICRSLDAAPCEGAGSVHFAPKAKAEFIDHLPPALTAGALRLLTYTVQLRNHSGRTAGPSNLAYSASGTAPEQITSFAADVRADGVLLHWQPSSGGASFIRIQRTLVLPPGQKAKSSSDQMRKGAEVPPQQTLESPYPSQHDPGRSLDKDVAFDTTYRYSVQRITKSTFAGHEVEVAGTPSETITIDARDIFPPAAPTGLVAVSSPEEHAIDLSWVPNTENDLVGYAVYRRQQGSNAAPTRISPPEPVAGPSFRDTTVQPNTTYVYSVSAIDQDKNESVRSPEIEASLPQ